LTAPGSLTAAAVSDPARDGQVPRDVPRHPADAPPVVAKTIARELAVDAGDLARYARRKQTHREHAGEIQRVYGYRDFSDRSAQAELGVWLHARAWTTAKRPSVLFDLATARLIEAKVLLPGASVLARLRSVSTRLRPLRTCLTADPGLS
jgi:uncharacterized protein YbjT (DUF2867 family)